MKKTLLILALLSGSLSLHVQAQVGVSVNIVAQPVWGPVGYDRADYYYMPDIETYYSVSQRQYYYFDHGRWVPSFDLPPRFRGYDLYHGYKVVINEPNPWFHHERYRQQYAMYRGRHDQPFIRDSRDERYFANPGHPQHGNWVQHHGDGHGGDRRYDNGRHDDRHDDGRHEGHYDDHHDH